MRLASRTGPPDWAIEKRYIKVLDEVGYPERAIANSRCASARNGIARNRGKC